MPRASTLMSVSMPCVGRPAIFGETLRNDVGEPTPNCSSPLMPRAVNRLAAADFVAASSGPLTGGATVGAGTGDAPSAGAPTAGGTATAEAIAQPKPVLTLSGLSTSVWKAGHGSLSAR